uniref:Uncharacterized protein n=1 Tax=Rhizophora mucronata TaxID=61149 RepID=A0A2P2IK68_RHIMU
MQLDTIFSTRTLYQNTSIIEAIINLFFAYRPVQSQQKLCAYSMQQKQKSCS